MKHFLLLISACLLLSSNLFAATPAQLDLARRCLELSGLDKALENVPTQIQTAGQQQAMTAKNPADLKLFLSMVLESFNGQQIKEGMVVQVADSLSADLLKRFIARQQEPWIKEILREELAASEPGAQAEMLRYLADLQSTPPSNRRISLIQQLVDATHMTEMAADMAVVVFKGMMQASFDPGEETQAEFEAKLGKVEGKLRASLKKAMRQQMIYGAFFTYRNIPDTMLERYIAYTYELDSQEFLDVFRASLSESMSAVFIHAGKDFIELLKTRGV